MKPIEILVVCRNISDIFLIRQAVAEEPFPTNIRVATSGQRGCQMLAARRYQPDLIILETLRSDMSILESVDPDVPVVVLTSQTIADDRRLAFELGVVDYVEKPTRPTEFVEVVSRIVRQWTAEPAHDR